MVWLFEPALAAWKYQPAREVWLERLARMERPELRAPPATPSRLGHERREDVGRVRARDRLRVERDEGRPNVA